MASTIKENGIKLVISEAKAFCFDKITIYIMANSILSLMGQES